MNVGDLRKLLETVSQDLLVVVNGYEGGLCDVVPEQIKKIKVHLRAEEGCAWYGPHGQHDVQKSGECGYCHPDHMNIKEPAVDAVLIER